MYVTLDIPSSGSSGFSKLFHTTLHYACIHAIGLNDPDEIVDAIYSEFTDQEVRKLGSTNAMKYWGDPTGTKDCYFVKQLLEIEDARCGVWSLFFIDML